VSSPHLPSHTPANILYFIHIDGKLNPSDVLTKFLSWAKFWPLIQPMLFWKGETIKDIHPSISGPPSGLRGVTSIFCVSPSDCPQPSDDLHISDLGIIPLDTNAPKFSGQSDTIPNPTKVPDLSAKADPNYPDLPGQLPSILQIQSQLGNHFGNVKSKDPIPSIPAQKGLLESPQGQSVTWNKFPYATNPIPRNMFQEPKLIPVQNVLGQNQLNMEENLVQSLPWISVIQTQSAG
jgi:hypothetical protein